MSSTIDNITCPKCGGNAHRETDHKTGEVYDHCTVCKYEEVITEGETVDEYNKITPGFVIQTYQKQGNTFICTEQTFTASDQIDREDSNGDSVDVDIQAEQYEPFNMVQPGLDYYVVGMMGCVEPEFHGPFATDDEQQKCIDKLREEKGEDENTFYVMNVSKGTKVEF